MLNLFIQCKRYIYKIVSYIILVHILGWKINNTGYYDRYSNGKYVLVYQYTTIFDLIFSTLFMFTTGLDVFALSKNNNTNELESSKNENIVSIVPLNIRHVLSRIIDINSAKPEEDKYFTVGKAINDINDRQNSILIISPEGTKNHTRFLGTAYRNIAYNTSSHILIIDIDYHEQTIDLRNIVDKNVVETTKSSQRIDDIVETEMTLSAPMYPDNSFIKCVKYNGDIITKMYNLNNSIVKYAPLLCLVSIVMYESIKYI